MTIVVSSGSIFLNQEPVQPASPCPAQLKNLDAYYINDPSDDCGPTVCINFFALTGAEILKYGIFRSIIGFVAPIPDTASLAGKTMQLAVNLGPTQTVTFDGTTPVVEQLKRDLIGVNVQTSIQDPANLILRIQDYSSVGVLQVIGGTALTDFSQTARTISEQSEDHLVTYIEAQETDDTDGVEYCDPDGNLNDFYRVATVNLQNEISYKTRYISPTESTGKVCCIYGVVSNLSGVRLPDVEVMAKIIQYPQSVSAPAYIDKEYVSTVTDPQGRFELCVLRGAQIHLEVPDTKYHRTVTVPDVIKVPITDLQVDRDYRYPLEIK